MNNCPSCEAPAVLDHPAGLVHSHTATCDLGAAEDATRTADFSRLMHTDYGMPLDVLTRAATDAERALLFAAGAAVPSSLTTTVRRHTSGAAVISRSWPPLVARPHVGTIDVSASGAGDPVLHVHRAVVTVNATGAGDIAE